MNSFVESLKRLYEKNMLSEKQINEILKSKKITTEEHLYILGKAGN